MPRHAAGDRPPRPGVTGLTGMIDPTGTAAETIACPAGAAA